MRALLVSLATLALAQPVAAQVSATIHIGPIRIGGAKISLVPGSGAAELHGVLPGSPARWEAKAAAARRGWVQPHTPLIPAKAGIQFFSSVVGKALGPRFRGDERS